MKTRILTLFLAATTLAWASTVTPAKRPAAPVLLKGGDIHTVSGGVLAKTDLLLVDGKFAAVGATFKAPAGTQVIDVTGKRIYPGLISASRRSPRSARPWTPRNSAPSPRTSAPRSPLTPTAR